MRQYEVSPRLSRYNRPDIMKVTAQMCRAGSLAELALALQIGGIELGIALVAIDLKNTAGLAKMAEDMVFLSVRGELIDCAGRGLACPRALIADVSPDPALPDTLAEPLVALAAIDDPDEPADHARASWPTSSDFLPATRQ